MSTFIDALDMALALTGEDAVLRRVISGGNVDCPCRAHVRSFRQRDEAFAKGSEQSQGEFDVILSPTEINRSGWPGVSTGINPSFPKNGDFIVIQGRQRAVMVVDTIMVAGELVRIEIRALG